MEGEKKNIARSLLKMEEIMNKELFCTISDKHGNTEVIRSERGIPGRIIFHPQKIELESWRQISNKLIETLDKISSELDTRYPSIQEMIATMNAKYKLKGYCATFSHLTKTVRISTEDPFDLGFIVGVVELPYNF